MFEFCARPCSATIEETLVLSVLEKPIGDGFFEDPAYLCKAEMFDTNELDVGSTFEKQGLLQEQKHVKPLARDPCLADAQAMCCSDPHLLEPRCLTLPPIRLEVVLDDGYQEGQRVMMEGPHGAFEVSAPSGSTPGEKLSYFLGPRPEFEVTAPPGVKPGSPIVITHDGVTLKIAVPEDCHPGEVFHVEPPVVMVKVPEGVAVGRSVYFKEADHGWLRACVPQELLAGGYFAARLPAPDAPAAPLIKSLWADPFLEDDSCDEIIM